MTFSIVSQLWQNPSVHLVAGRDGDPWGLKNMCDEFGIIARRLPSVPLRVSEDRHAS